MDVPDSPNTNNNIKLFLMKSKLYFFIKEQNNKITAAKKTLVKAIILGEKDFKEISIKRKALPNNITKSIK